MGSTVVPAKSEEKKSKAPASGDPELAGQRLDQSVGAVVGLPRFLQGDRRPLNRTNQAVTAPLRSEGIRAKLEVGSVNDPLEREAEQVAERITQMPGDSLVDASCTCTSGGDMCGACKSDQLDQTDPGSMIRRSPEMPPLLHRRASGDANMAAARAEVFPGSPGRPLDRSQRAYFGPRLGADLQLVRLHDDGQTAATAQSIGARAFAVGNEIGFAAGRFAPDTPAGRKLLAHELVHVAQYSAAGGATIRRDPDPQPANADDPAIAAQYEDELQANEKNAEQDGDAALRAYASRVVLLLTFQPHAALHSDNDLRAVMEPAYAAAKTEIDTLNALGGTAELALGIKPYGFPLTWSERIKDALSLGIDRLSVLRELLLATTNFVVLSTTTFRMPSCLTVCRCQLARSAYWPASDCGCKRGRWSMEGRSRSSLGRPSVSCSCATTRPLP